MRRTLLLFLLSGVAFLHACAGGPADAADAGPLVTACGGACSDAGAESSPAGEPDAAPRLEEGGTADAGAPDGDARAAAPDLDISAGSQIPSGGSHDLGSRAGDSIFDVTYTLANNGTKDLVFGGVTILAGTLTNCLVIISKTSPARLGPGAKDTVVLAVHAGTAPGPFGFTFEVSNDSPGETSYRITVHGTVP